MATRGSFGLLGYGFDIGATRVTLTRNVWLPFALVAVGIAGGVAFSVGITSKHGGTNLLALGIPACIVGVFALFTTPWLSPSSITATREGLAWGSSRYAPADLQTLKARVTTLRRPNGAGYDSWMLLVVRRGGQRPLLLDLGDRRIRADHSELDALARAMAEMLGVRASA